MDDQETALKRRELEQIFSILHLLPIDDAVLARARDNFGVSVRALDVYGVEVGAR